MKSLAIGKNRYFPKVFQINERKICEVEMRKFAKTYPIDLQRSHLETTHEKFNLYKSYIELFPYLREMKISVINDNLLATDLVFPQNIEYVALDFHVSIHNE